MEASTPQVETLGEWLAREPYTLSMSSGFFGFFAHAGFLSACESRGLQPKALTGSSAGALIAGISAAGMPGPQICEELKSLSRAEFWDPAMGFGLLRGRSFEDKLRRLLPVTSFEECRCPLAISVFNLRSMRTEVITSGDLPSAIVASCAFPGLFQPIRRRSATLWDGGIRDRPGLEGTSGEERVLHHNIVSRSPWRRKGSKAIEAPERENLVSLNLHNLPRSGPFKLERGHEALHMAQELTELALGDSVTPSMHR